jgi:hypothetical protein
MLKLNPELMLRNNACRFIFRFNGFALLFIIAVLVSCTKDKQISTYRVKVQVPVYVQKADFRAGFKVSAAQPIQQAGKILVYGHYLLVNDLRQGIHLYDNTNPSRPFQIAFISIPGNFDMAVKENILYADSYCDLLAIDMSNPALPLLKSRLEDIYPLYTVDKEKGLIAYYKEEEKEVSAAEYNQRRIDYESGGNLAIPMSGTSVSAPSASGSESRFAVNGDCLYMIGKDSISIISISTPSQPVFHNGVSCRDAETICTEGNRLFIGTSLGVYVYDASNPLNIIYESRFEHMRSCDPVVVQGSYAYVTLHSGGACGGTINHLEVMDVSHLPTIIPVRSYEMTNPHGLGIDGKNLFICDGTDGLKVFDASDPNAIDSHPLGHYGNMETYDVIPYDNTLILSTKTGIYEYDYSNASHLKLLSELQ